MEHIAYCESKAKELDNLLENDGSGIIKAKRIVSDVFHSEALTPKDDWIIVNTIDEVRG